MLQLCLRQIAFEQQLPDALRRENLRTAWREGDAALPALYISHGAPPLFEDAAWMDELWQWADALPTPRGILIVSAHWEAAPLSLSAVVDRPTWSTTSAGLTPATTGCGTTPPRPPSLAADVLATLPDGWNVHQHTSRGLDHGAWVPLKVMYPGADDSGAATEPSHARPRTRCCNWAATFGHCASEGFSSSAQVS